MSIDLSTPAQNLKKQRIDFDIKQFRAALQQKGISVQWEQMSTCPCAINTSSDLSLDLKNVNDVDIRPSTNRLDCTNCGGLGRYVHSTINIKAITTDAGGHEKTQKTNLYKNEDIKFTLEPEHLPSYGDRFTLTNSVMVMRETFEIQRVNALLTNIKLSRPVKERTLTLLSGEETVGILNLLVTNTSGEVVDSQDRKSLATVNNDGTITLQNNLNVFPDGALASITYYASPRYLINSYPHSVRDTFVRINNVETPTPLPVQCMGRLETSVEKEFG